MCTPGVVVAGREWRGWFAREALTLPRAPAIGRLRLEVLDSMQATLSFAPVHALGDDLHYTVALLGFDLQTNVPRGENADKTLCHDFVVLAVQAGELTHAVLRFE